jgi:hypothetical protein
MKISCMCTFKCGEGGKGGKDEGGRGEEETYLLTVVVRPASWCIVAS